MKYVKRFLIFLLIAVVISGFAFHENEYTQTEFMLDTVITVTAYGNNAKSATKAAFKRIKEIEDKFNAYDESSEVSRINKSEKTQNVDSEVYNLIKKSLEFSYATEGAFDITLKPLSDLWRIGTENERVPSESEIEAAILRCGSSFVSLSDDDMSVTFLKEDMSFDLGAVAKGYAAEEAVRVLKENGVKNAYLDLGGNVAVIGKKPLGLFENIFNLKKERDFVIGIQHPTKSRGEIIDTVTGNDNYIVTSGAYERCFYENGIRYHHILDSETGYPAESEFDSVTVISKDGTAADMISTALFVMGKDGLELISGDLYEEIIFVKDEKIEHVKSVQN